MSDEPKKSRWLPWTAAGLLALPLLYVASFGPTLWLHGHRWISGDVVTAGWRPLLEFVLLSDSPASGALEWYGRLWVTDDSLGRSLSALFLQDFD